MNNTMAKRTEEEAARYGFHKVRGYGNDRHRTGWEVTCSHCTKVFRAFWPPDVPPEQMVKNMRVRRWNIGVGLRPLCPDCLTGKKTVPLPKPDDQSFDRFIPPEPETSIYHALLTAVDKTTGRRNLLQRLDVATDRMLNAQEKFEQAKQTAEELRAQEKKARRDERQQRREARRAEKLAEEAARMRQVASDLEKKKEEENDMGNPSLKITHTVFQLLDSVFDRAKKTYRASYNDARVAKDCGTTEEIVAALRREVYGELAEDPRIQAIKDDISLLEMQFAEITKNCERGLADLNSRVEQLRVNLLR